MEIEPYQCQGTPQQQVTLTLFFRGAVATPWALQPPGMIVINTNKPECISLIPE